MESKEDLFGKNIASIMGRDPVVPDNISARLALARKEALKHIGRDNFIRQNSNTVAVSKKSKINFSQWWLLVGALAIALLSAQVYNKPQDTDDVDYYMNSDTVELDFLK